MVQDTKEVLFDFLHTNKNRILPLLAHRRYAQLADMAIDGCKASISLDAQNTEIIATGLLHYILTKSLIPSQRKTFVDDVKIDIAIPGLREMRQNAQNAVVIIVCCESDVAKRRLAQTSQVQPVTDNIWLLTQDADVSHARTYSIYQKKPDLGDMMHDLIKFVKSRRQRQLGIVGSL